MACSSNQAGDKTAAGAAGEMCGGPWLNEVMRVDCGWAWETYFLVVGGVAGALYLAVGVYRPLIENKGLPLRQVLTVHPHYPRWCELASLVQVSANRPLPAPSARLHAPNCRGRACICIAPAS